MIETSLFGGLILGLIWVAERIMPLVYWLFAALLASIGVFVLLVYVLPLLYELVLNF